MSYHSGKNKLWHKCDHKDGCNNTSPKVTGLLDQEHYRQTDKAAKSAGWRVNLTDSRFGVRVHA